MTILERALVLDPRSSVVESELGFTYTFRREWSQAADSLDRAIALAPDLINLKIRRGFVEFWWKGETAMFRNTLASLPAGVDPDGQVTLARVETALLDRDFAAADKAITACQLDRIVPTACRCRKTYLQGQIALARGDLAAARAFFEASLPSFEAEVQASPTDGLRHASLGVLYEFLGRKKEAIREARRAVELIPMSRDAFLAPKVLGALALVDGRSGQADEAIALIKQLLTTPMGLDASETDITHFDLEKRWQWEPLRSDPRFHELLSSPGSMP